MSKKCYRYFGGLLNTQAKWLNKMAEKGYRLVRTGKLLYEFEKCKPDEVTYCVEFIGEKSKESSIDYANFLEDIGYKVFFKNTRLSSGEIISFNASAARGMSIGLFSRLESAISLFRDPSSSRILDLILLAIYCITSSGIWYFSSP